MWPKKKTVIDYLKNFYVFSFITGSACTCCHVTIVSRLDRTYCVRLRDRDGTRSASDSRKEYRVRRTFFGPIGNAGPIQFVLIARSSELRGDNTLVYGYV